VKKECTIEEVNKVFLEASETSHKGFVVYTEDPIVSVDVVGNSASCLFDSQLTSVLGKMVKIVSWYDNEMGYSHRLADLIKKIS
jgi:glyceraldehyde 3-phosphate dehydrogenase